MTREQHLQWCKDRALEYIHAGDIANGLTSMLSDIRKHPDTDSPAMASLCMMTTIMAGRIKTTEEAEKFINGFN